MNRREFLSKLMLTATVGTFSSFLFADDDEEDKTQTPNTSTKFVLANTNIVDQQVVVIGAGMAGATLAKYLRLWGGAGLTVTLVEPNPSYVSNIMSNLVLSGQRTLNSLHTAYTDLTTQYGVIMKQAHMVSFDNTAKTVTLSDNSILPYHRLVLAPGVEFAPAYGLTLEDYDTQYPHAWHAGIQTQVLADQIFAMQAGDTFVMSIPKKPYRCPPGPYERACLIADYLKTAGKTGCKVVILDENAEIQAEKTNFTNAFNNIHSGWIDYHANVSNIMVDKTTNSVTFNEGVISNAKVISLIPPHHAPSVMQTLCADGRWASVDVLSYESTVSGMSGIHVIGDASNTTQPKAGHIANQEAKVCADAIVRLLQGQQPDPAPVTNSACYSPITNSTASWLTGVYQYDTTTKTMRLWANGQFTDTAIEASAISSKHFSQMNTWFTTLMADSFR
jgi:NADPH-dependent 2,4-dienoyl-CoA reductase/sulfur reductase-like enzyme